MNHRRCSPIIFPLLLGIQIASAQLEQAAAIREFAIPKFDQDGRRAWILSGQELRRHSQEEATVVEMDLQTYAASRQEVPETRLRSPTARFFFSGNRADGNQTIQVEGPDYKISGTGWRWNGENHHLVIEQEVKVIFDATLTDFLESDCDPGNTNPTPSVDLPLRPLPKEEGQTRIHSDKLELFTNEKDHRFLFDGEVRIMGRNLKVSCDHLEVISTRSPDENEGPGAFGSIAKIVARGNVRIEQRERSAVAGKAIIDVAGGTILLEDDPVVFDDRGKVTGYKIILYRGERRVEVLPGKSGQARPTVILPPLRDLGGAGPSQGQKKNEPPQSSSPRRP